MHAESQQELRVYGGQSDERVVVLFDKAGVVRFQPLDEEALRAEVLERVDGEVAVD